MIKKAKKLLSIFASILVFGIAPTLVLDYFSGAEFLEKFMADQSLSLLGTILAIYIGVASSFIAILNGYEDEQGKSIFAGVSKELKQTVIWLFGVFFIHFLILVGTPQEPSLICELTLKALKTFTFLLFLCILYELSVELFMLRNKLPRKDKKQ